MNADPDSAGSFARSQTMARETGPFVSLIVTALERFSETLLDTLYPRACAGCGRIDHDLCPRCQRQLLHPAAPLLIDHCPPPLTAAVATAHHAGIVREVIQTLKYDARPQLGAVLGQRVFAAFGQLKWTVDLIVPVPLHASRLRERGYNQSQRIAATVAAMSGIPLSTASLIRTRVTRSQVGLSGPERRQNLLNAFTAISAEVSQRRILLIDDVFTTGSTLSACATALHNAGAASVYGLTVSAARL
ncbi:MAG: ComF family protein [Candidatus Flexifilum sp.]